MLWQVHSCASGGGGSGRGGASKSKKRGDLNPLQSNERLVWCTSHNLTVALLYQTAL